MDYETISSNPHQSCQHHSLSSLVSYKKKKNEVSFWLVFGWLKELSIFSCFVYILCPLFYWGDLLKFLSLCPTHCKNLFLAGSLSFNFAFCSFCHTKARVVEMSWRQRHFSSDKKAQSWFRSVHLLSREHGGQVSFQAKRRSGWVPSWLQNKLKLIFPVTESQMKSTTRVLVQRC